MYYFAYGSNMNLDHMRRLCGWHFNVLGRSILNDYEFGTDNRGFFAIRPKTNSQVRGVLYKLDQECLNILDDFEGCPNVFTRVEVEVADEAGQNYKAWVYVEGPEKFGDGHIQPDYLKRAIAGARENRLPESWIEFLESFAVKPKL